MKARKVLLGGSIVAETLSSIDPSREYKQSFIQEWQDSWSINQEEWWKLRGDKVSSDVLKSSNA
ncbi:MAG: hypothetical protein OEX81_05545, partial [Candidatus Pacebacteria bacterium]|nr:hypothetical protein [Candidatus Paceibacterota bacterium]